MILLVPVMEDGLKLFDCGCSVRLESDEDDPARTADVFSYERCEAHSVSAADPGPIGQYIQDHRPNVPLAPIVQDARAAARITRKLVRQVKADEAHVSRRRYYEQHRADYGKYELARLKAMLAREQDSGKQRRILARIERREVAMGKCPTSGCGGIANHGGACQVA